MPAAESFFPTSRLMEVARDAVADSHAFIRQAMSGGMKFSFEKIHLHPGGPDEKISLMIDRLAEQSCRSYFARQVDTHVHVIGEETQGEEIPEARVHALVDVVDGTDLLAMGIPLWCSAIVLFDEQKPRPILGAVVGLATGEIYMASHVEDRVTVTLPPTVPDGATLTRLVSGPSSTLTLKNARIAHYGQKPKNFLSLHRLTRFLGTVESMHRRDPFRIYNFAGNPIMMKLADRPKDEETGKDLTDGIDAVFDVSGQLLHDVVPGAFIALKAGAYLCDLDKRPIGYEALGALLATPKLRLKYVLAATRNLAEELCDALRDEPPAPGGSAR